MTTTWIKKGGDHADKGQHITISEVKFYTAGGGFEQTGKASAFFEQFEPVKELPERPPLRPIVVQIEDGASMAAWTAGRRWNGWECPLATRENFELLVKADEWDSFSFDPDGSLRYANPDYAEEGEDGVVVIKPALYRVLGSEEPLELYDLSDLGFIWSEVRVEEEEDDEDLR